VPTTTDPNPEVTGTVTVDNQPPPEGSSITFIPADGKQSPGTMIQGGKYTVRDVPVGVATVEIRVPKLADPEKEQAKSGPGRGVEELLPAKYNDQSELRFEVKPGRNEKNWDLSTGGK
jgi:hypothetical protein